MPGTEINDIYATTFIGAGSKSVGAVGPLMGAAAESLTFAPPWRGDALGNKLARLSDAVAAIELEPLVQALQGDHPANLRVREPNVSHA